jgi:hypothetical protein
MGWSPAGCAMDGRHDARPSHWIMDGVWAINLQRQFAEDEIRGACQRVMPETVQRCVDTVIIQRGGARR